MDALIMTPKARIAAAIAAPLLVLGAVAPAASHPESEAPRTASVQLVEDDPGFNCQTMGNQSGCANATRDWDKDGKVGDADPWLNNPNR